MPPPFDELPDALSEHRAKGTQIEEILEGVVARLGPGGQLPSERQLVERFDVARMTVRGAIESLIARGLVYRAPGLGTFVAEPRFAQSEALTSFTDDMHRRGLEPGGTVLAHDVTRSARVAGRLRIAADAELVRIVRLRTADGQPMAIERAHLPLARFPGLQDIDLGDTSLYEALRRRWDVSVHHADQRVQAVLLEPDDAQALHVAAGGPGFRFVRLTSDPAGVPVEYVESIYRGDRYEVRTHLHRGMSGGDAARGDQPDASGPPGASGDGRP